MIRILKALIPLLAGCYLRQYPVTPEVADPSVYRVETSEVTGTAWTVANGYAVTAGHVCRHSEHEADHAIWLKTAMWTVPATPIIWEMTPGPEADVCVLATHGPLGYPLILAQDEPAVGAPDTAIGYPNEQHSESHGVYAGHGNTSAPVDHGSSGGPVFTPAGVYGIVTQCRRDVPVCNGALGAALTPVAEIKHVLELAGVPYDITPPDPPAPEDVF